MVNKLDLASKALSLIMEGATYLLKETKTAFLDTKNTIGNLREKSDEELIKLVQAEYGDHLKCLGILRQRGYTTDDILESITYNFSNYSDERLIKIFKNSHHHINRIAAKNVLERREEEENKKEYF